MKLLKSALGLANRALKPFELELRRTTRDAGAVFPSDFTPVEVAELYASRPYTMTSPERIVTLCRAVEYLVRYGIEGSIAECGVWKGGSMLAVARTLLRLGDTSRELYLYDTYEGMPEPGEEDVSHQGELATALWSGGGRHRAELRMEVPLERVKRVLYASGYPPERLHFIQGRVQDTLPERAPEKLSLMRLDTNWYSSTRHELEVLFPRLVRGGVVVIDDYGHWLGARKATDEFFANHPVLLQRVDYTGRVGVRL